MQQIVNQRQRVQSCLDTASDRADRTGYYFVDIYASNVWFSKKNIKVPGTACFYLGKTEAEPTVNDFKYINQY